MDELELAAGFAEGNEEQWLELVRTVLAGRDFRRTLVSETRDGIAVAPLYGQRDPGRRVGSAPGRWHVFQRADHPDPDDANLLARADVDGGADGLELVFPGSIRSAGFGLAVESLGDLARVLDGIDLGATRFRIDAGYEIRNALICMAALVEEQGVDPAGVDVIGLCDPVTSLATEGRLVASYDEIADNCADMLHAVLGRGLGVRPYCVDARGVHGAGGTAAQELAYALADAMEIARQLERRGIEIDRSIATLTFAMAADADQFETIAKFRAFRMLWARVLDACGLPPAEAHLHAQTSWRMMARRDPWTNILRSAVAVAAAGLGGADSVTVLPFTLAMGLPDAFARRIARNVQLVLIEEAGLGRVADPAAGSGYLETLSAEMCETAWEIFQSIERDGGLLACVRDGKFQDMVLKMRERLTADVASRRFPLVGVSEFPLLQEYRVRVLEPAFDSVRTAGRTLKPPRAGRGERFDALVAEVRGGATFADLATVLESEWMRAPELCSMRLAESFERLRDAADAATQANGSRPPVFLATLGRVADFAARASFARNAFAAGGLEAHDGMPYSDVDEAVEGFKTSGAVLACICGGDAAYDEHAAGVAQGLKRAGARLVWLAGRPGARESEWRAAGIDAFIFAGCDILSELTAAHRALGIADTQGTEAD